MSCGVSVEIPLYPALFLFSHLSMQPLQGFELPYSEGHG